MPIKRKECEQMTLQDRHEIHFNQKEEITPEISAYRAEHLIKTGNQAHIILGDQKYVLRITRSNKLILTK